MRSVVKCALSALPRTRLTRDATLFVHSRAGSNGFLAPAMGLGVGEYGFGKANAAHDVGGILNIRHYHFGCSTRFLAACASCPVFILVFFAFSCMK
jgi:hypothetical protein